MLFVVTSVTSIVPSNFRAAWSTHGVPLLFLIALQSMFQFGLMALLHRPRRCQCVATPFWHRQLALSKTARARADFKFAPPLNPAIGRGNICDVVHTKHIFRGGMGFSCRPFCVVRSTPPMRRAEREGLLFTNISRPRCLQPSVTGSLHCERRVVERRVSHPHRKRAARLSVLTPILSRAKLSALGAFLHSRDPRCIMCL